jgi:hypothetical protein
VRSSASCSLIRGHGQLIALSSYLRQLLDQLLFESVQLRTPCGDALQHLGIHHGPESRSGTRDDGRESTNPLLPDDLDPRLPPTTSTSTPKRGHATPLTSHFKMAELH